MDVNIQSNRNKKIMYKKNIKDVKIDISKM